MFANNMLLKESVVENNFEISRAIAHATNRLELCSRLDVGGFTPEEEMIIECLKHNIPTLIMIRVEDNFNPSKTAFKLMKTQIKKYRNYPLLGFVFGILNEENEIDIKRIKKLKKLSKDKQTIFHMAFDKIQDKNKAIDILSKLKITRILTKGGDGKAMDNIENLKQIVAYAKNKIEVVVGGKVDDKNYKEIADLTGATQFHGRSLGIEND